MAQQWKPKFKPSDESCKIVTHNETRARLVAGGTFFRSKDVGSHWNDINLQIKISTLNSGGFNNPILVPAPLPTLWVTNGWTAATTVVELTVTYPTAEYINYYYVEQGQTNLMPPPECTVHAPSSLRALVNADPNRIIEMPTADTPTLWNSGVNELTTCLLSAFNSNMSGGDSGPVGAAGVRTGPEKAIVYINQSEKDSPTGVLEDVQKLLEFNGSEWVPYSP